MITDRLIGVLQYLLILVLLILFSSQISKAQIFDSTKITASYQNVNIIEVFKDIEQKSPVKIYYKPEWFKDVNISFSANDFSLRQVLDLAVKDTKYLYDIIPDNAVVLMPRESVAMILGRLNMMSDNSITDLNIRIIGLSEDIGKNKKAEIKGHVTDVKSGEPIIGAKIRVANTKVNSTTDLNGNYTLSLPPGVYTISVSQIGFETSNEKIKLISNGFLNVELFEKSLMLNEVVVTGLEADKNVKRAQMSLVEMNAKDIKELPSTFGEKDIIKSMTMLPGIKSVGEFGSDINVRGGGSDQNLFLIEGSPLFNTSHVLGLLSAVNPDATGSIALYKGDIPAYFGERVSSVMQIQLKDGDYKQYHVTGGIGLINSRLMIDGPIWKNKASFIISGRTSYSDWLLKQMPDIDLRNSSAKFYDINGLFNWNIDSKNKITLFGYASNDAFTYTNQLKYQYANKLASAHWNHSFNNKLFSSLNFSYSKYDVNKDDISNTFEKGRTTSGVLYKNANFNLNYNPNTKHKVNAGLQGIKYNTNPGEVKPLDDLSNVVPDKLQQQQAIETAAWLNDKYEINDHISINAGLRYSEYFFLGADTVYHYREGVTKSIYSVTDTVFYKKGSVIKKYGGLEPRLSIKYQLEKSSSVKLSYNRNIQYISLISYTSIPTPDDIWKLSDPNIKPIICNQFAVGYFKNFKQNAIETSVEFYFKKQNNLVEYKNGAVLSMNPMLETALINANGMNYGAELYIKKNTGKLDGWISYTYSRSLKKTNSDLSGESINNNTYYPSNYDIPNDLTMVGNYHITRKVRFGFTFNYSTGRAITLPELKYMIDNNWVIQYSDRNKYRLPDYDRLDLSISFDESLKKKQKWKSSWTFTLVNVYGRKNAYSIYYKNETPSEQNNFNSYSLYKLYIIGKPFPTLTYNFIF